MAEPLILDMTDGTRIAVPASLDSHTGYVLLEQEAWYEKEPHFFARVLKPGMVALDIGANHGVYGLSFARAVGPWGRVYAYEPASAARALLEESRIQNRLANFDIIPKAVSDSVRDGYLVFGPASEKNTLGFAGPGEAITITALDTEMREQGWERVDVVKIDAEGEEARILEGGQAFFRRFSPLVMFEANQGEAERRHLHAAFAALGYGIYRSLPDAALLMPVSPEDPINAIELNLFAVKQDRAEALAQDGFLVTAVPSWRPGRASLDGVLAALRAQPFAAAFGPLFTMPVADVYRECLAGYAAWRDRARAPAERFAALSFAQQQLWEFCESEPTLARLATLARLSWECGARKDAVAALYRLGEAARQGEDRIDEPFWLPSPRFDGFAPHQRPDLWFRAAATEAYVRASFYSSFFGGARDHLDYLCALPFSPTEMERRRVLMQARTGTETAVPARLRSAAADHRNAGVWRNGRVPHTFVR